jgi:hypothetical protein
MRGHQTLFNEIIEESPLRVVKGRSERLDSQRNQCLVERWLYMMKVTGWRYDLMLRMISTDFFLSERTIINVLDENNSMLRSIRNDLPTRKDLEKKWPQFSWETPTLEMYL